MFSFQFQFTKKVGVVWFAPDMYFVLSFCLDFHSIEIIDLSFSSLFLQGFSYFHFLLFTSNFSIFFFIIFSKFFLSFILSSSKSSSFFLSILLSVCFSFVFSLFSKIYLLFSTLTYIKSFPFSLFILTVVSFCPQPVSFYHFLKQKLYWIKKGSDITEFRPHCEAETSLLKANIIKTLKIQARLKLINFLNLYFKF